MNTSVLLMLLRRRLTMTFQVMSVMMLWAALPCLSVGDHQTLLAPLNKENIGLREVHFMLLYYLMD